MPPIIARPWALEVAAVDDVSRPQGGASSAKRRPSRHCHPCPGSRPRRPCSLRKIFVVQPACHWASLLWNALLRITLPELDHCTQGCAHPPGGHVSIRQMRSFPADMAFPPPPVYQAAVGSRESRTTWLAHCRLVAARFSTTSPFTQHSQALKRTPESKASPSARLRFSTPQP